MGFLDFLRSSRDARKIFGKREIKIIEKQLYGVNLTQSEKNRLSRDIRKKLCFIKEAAGFSEEFELKKASEVKKIVNETKEIILKSPSFGKIKRIILYGSSVENKLTFKSDLDIAVEFSEIDLKEATLFRKDILGEANHRVDIQVYNHLPAAIKRDIEREGRVLYKK